MLAFLLRVLLFLVTRRGTGGHLIAKNTQQSGGGAEERDAQGSQPEVLCLVVQACSLLRSEYLKLVYFQQIEQSHRLKHTKDAHGRFAKHIKQSVKIQYPRGIKIPTQLELLQEAEKTQEASGKVDL